jgi:FKBP-type peptidyl-prolyl cis-trans isomerase SlyD
MSESVQKDSVVTFNYKLRDEQGNIIEESPEGHPVAVLHGHGSIVRGLDTALANHVVGDKFSVTVPPELGYGLRREDWVQRISKKHLPKTPRLQVGMQSGYRTDQGVRRVTIVKVGAKMVDVDLNHPFAGLNLQFDIDIVAVRQADAEELAHGHVHGAGGHHH